ncbi:MAG: hypothetical protein JW798_11550 [Prolixibacteraceae bacterium]|nr:hypothetical protein [Prolixibacteraceae bacterium]
MDDYNLFIDRIKEAIEKEHKTGMQAGGSGHMGFVSYTLNDFKVSFLNDNTKEITFQYTIYVETEFTYEPDNPPYSYPYCKKIHLNSKNQAIGKPEEALMNETTEWIETKKKIVDSIQKKLLRIEWGYGDNRAPVKFPPRFIETEEPDQKCYVCLIEPDFGDDEPPLIIKSNSPGRLNEKILETLKERFGI